MALKPVCDMCDQELTDFGAILFGPPNSDSQVKKLHLCQDCYAKLLAQMQQ